MSYNNGPRIVTSGLVMYLDAGNRRSFVSGSSTWNDLSRNGNTANASGTPVFSTDGNGCFDFATATGVNANGASMGFTFNSNMVTTTGNFTFECWIKNPPASNQQGMFANAPGGDGGCFLPDGSQVRPLPSCLVFLFVGTFSFFFQPVQYFFQFCSGEPRLGGESHGNLTTQCSVQCACRGR
jgi:hypothetical protein